MRIGTLAATVGVTTRTVRHYHRIGLLPEPPRQSNGYRDYSLRDAVALARVRRLIELGLSLDEIGDVLADEAGKDPAEILAELDADLARQEKALRRRRARLGRLLEQIERTGRLPAEAPVSPELAALFDDMARASARLPGPEPETAAMERQLLALLETGSPGVDRGWLHAVRRGVGADEEAVRSAYDIYARMDDLAEAAEDDPRVEETARAIVGSMPDEVAQAVAQTVTAPKDIGGPAEEGGFTDALFAELAPAQAAAVRRAIRLLGEGAGCEH